MFNLDNFTNEKNKDAIKYGCVFQIIRTESLQLELLDQEKQTHCLI